MQGIKVPSTVLINADKSQVALDTNLSGWSVRSPAVTDEPLLVKHEWHSWCESAQERLNDVHFKVNHCRQYLTGAPTSSDKLQVCWLFLITNCSWPNGSALLDVDCEGLESWQVYVSSSLQWLVHSNNWPTALPKAPITTLQALSLESALVSATPLRNFCLQHLFQISNSAQGVAK